MWLQYGVDANNQLVAIENVASGKTELICPYCGSDLIAKKGKVKQHHFTHLGDSCRMVVKREPLELPTLPLYDAFDIFLTGKQLEQLKKIWRRHKSHNNGIHRLEVLPAFTREKLLSYNSHLKIGKNIGAYQFTDLGLIPVGALPLATFNSVQEPLLLQKLAHFEAAFFDRRGAVIPEVELSICLTDLRIYCAAFRKILLSTLYYLEVMADGQTLYKIGITTRSISQRVAEVKRDLLKHYKSVAIKVLGTWDSRGNVEKYFKYKYADFNYPIGTLTEYFKFDVPDDAIAVQHDLQQMQLKVLSPLEQDIFDGQPNPLEQALCREPMLMRSRSFKQQMLLEREAGVQIKYLNETELAQAFLSSPSSVRVIKALYQGSSLREAAEIASVSVDAARKVLAVLQNSRETFSRSVS